MASEALTRKKKKRKDKTTTKMKAEVSDMASWILHCFHCGHRKHRHGGSMSSKNLIKEDDAEMGVGRGYEELYNVRGSHVHFQSLDAVCNNHHDEELDGGSFPSLHNASQGKSEGQAKLKAIYINASQNEEKRIDPKLEDLRKKTSLLIATTQMYSIKNLAGIHFESASSQNTQCQSYKQGCSQEIRRISSSKQATLQYGSLDSDISEGGKVNACSIQCGEYDELSNEVNEWINPDEDAHQYHSPPWASSYNNSEACEDLLLDHMDFSCLIEDSTPISAWENSFTKLCSGKEGLTDGSIKKPVFQEIKTGLQKVEPISSSQPRINKVDSSSGRVLDELEFEHDMITLNFCSSHEGDGDFIDSRGRILEQSFYSKALSQRWICMDMEKVSNPVEGCFSPCTNLLSRSWRDPRRVTPEQASVKRSTSENHQNSRKSLPLQDQSFGGDELSSVLSGQLFSVECEDEVRSNVISCQCSELHSSNEGFRVHDGSLESSRMVDYVGVPSSCQSEEGGDDLMKKMYNINISKAFCHELEHDSNGHGGKNGFVREANGSAGVLDDGDVESNDRLKEENHGSYLIREAETSFKEEEAKTNGREEAASDYGPVESDECRGKQEDENEDKKLDVIEIAVESRNESEDKIERVDNDGEKKPMIEVGIKNGFFAKEAKEWQSSSERISAIEQSEAPAMDIYSSKHGDDDRPILGTVAAHWSPISVSASKWWDGKGIPNSTCKYKEDQKVRWHVMSFEERLEKALAKQDCI